MAHPPRGAYYMNMPDLARRWTFLAAGFLAIPGGGHAAAQQHVPTPVRLVVDTLHGTQVPDPYRWLEDLSSPEVQAWFRSQGAAARTALDALPGHAALLQRMRQIGAAAPPEISLPYAVAERWFYTIRRAGDSVARGYVRDARTGKERLLVDPALVRGSGGAGAARLATFLPSPDGRLVLYGVSTGGDEWVVLRLRDVATGRDVEGPFERNRWDETVLWDPGGRAFYYWQVREPRADAPPAERHYDVRMFRHLLGRDPRSDLPVLSAAMVRLEPGLFPALDLNPNGTVALGQVASGPYSAWYTAPASDLATGTPAWRSLFALADSVIAVVPHGADLYVLTSKATQRILRTRLDAPDLATAATIMTGGDVNLQAMGGALDGLYVQTFSRGVNRLTLIPWGGSPIVVELPPGTSIAEADFGSQVRVDARRSGAVLLLSSGTAVTRPYRYDAAAARLAPLSLGAAGPYDALKGYVAETLHAPSHDGVRVPLYIVRPARLARDGSMPVLLYGYGAYGMTDAPLFDAIQTPWYESGGAIVDCHVRGGGYYGDAWHRGGQKETKPNTWLDFIACAEHLVREGYTRPERLFAVGGSAGGITVGRAITERPDLFAAAVISNGVLDHVRSEASPIGQANIPEFGSVASEKEFRGLLAMSAYHHVRPGTAYPAVLLMTGLSDIRVPPWHSGKMIAALQAASSARPALLRVEESGGHVSGAVPADARGLLQADLYAFLMAAGGLPPYHVPPSDQDRRR